GGIGQTAGPGRRSFGANAGNLGERIEQIYRRCKEAGIAAEIQPEIKTVLWEKFVFICGFSGTTALTRLTIGPVLGCQETKAFLRETMTEVEAVARSQGVVLSRGLEDRPFPFAWRLE